MGAAHHVNCKATAYLVARTRADGQFVYLSTDQVYPDTKGPHREGEENPVNAYGRSKLAGEYAALAFGRALVLRTNLFGPSRTPGRASLSDFVVERLRADQPITLFADILFSPLHLATLAELVVACVTAKLSGVFNLGSREGMSKLDFGLSVAQHLKLSTAAVARGRAADIARRAPRPSDLRLDVSRIEKMLGRTMPTLREEIAKLESGAP